MCWFFIIILFAIAVGRSYILDSGYIQSVTTRFYISKISLSILFNKNKILAPTFVFFNKNI
ncbi:hypothetical protein CXF81_08505 [Glaciecola sp. 33A]|nr:hypothetical protein CXF81_08505 [Glaciecola sp. 33A]